MVQCQLRYLLCFYLMSSLHMSRGWLWYDQADSDEDVDNNNHVPLTTTEENKLEPTSLVSFVGNISKASDEKVGKTKRKRNRKGLKIRRNSHKTENKKKVEFFDLVQTRTSPLTREVSERQEEEDRSYNQQKHNTNLNGEALKTNTEQNISDISRRTLVHGIQAPHKDRLKKETNKVQDDQDYLAFSSRSYPGHCSPKDVITLEPIREYLSSCQDCFRTKSSYQRCPLHQAVADLSMWSDQLKKILSTGCTSSGYCGNPRCLVTTSPVLPSVNKLANKIKDLFYIINENIESPRQDTNPSQTDCGHWSSWSHCSVTCGTGTQTRRRRCDYTERTDFEQTSQSKTCLREPCGPQCGPWGDWGHCSVSCGQGQKVRRRQCRGEGPRSEVENCNKGQCDVAGYRSSRGCSPWMSWTVCSVTCGRGYRRRVRQCSDRNDETTEDQVCGGGECVPPNNPNPNPNPNRDLTTNQCDTWSAWSRCSVTCGRGLMNRVRGCRRGSRLQTLEKSTCQQAVCPDLCGQWSSWGACSVTCGLGLQSRRQWCRGGEGHREDRKQCVMEGCDISRPIETWCSQWSSWGRCSVSCGRGQRSRYRRCSSGGNDEESQTCEDKDCPPPPGSWSVWSEWSACPVTCGTSKTLRSRVCRPYQGLAEGHCPGEGHQSRQQNCGGQCPSLRRAEIDSPIAGGCQLSMWSLWGPWSRCSRTCGKGVKRRLRYCEVIQPGRRCGETGCSHRLAGGEQVEECDNKCQCEIRDWTEWSVWSVCSVSCGRGVQTRHRDCHISTIGQTCPDTDRCASSGGQGSMERRCNNGHCKRYEYSDWRSWSNCDCATGKVHRLRECYSVTRQTGARSKVALSHCQEHGAAREEKYCDVREKCPECITSCHGKPDGVYLSCRGCQHYVVCDKQNTTNYRCKIARTQFDSFSQKCVSPPSPSCPLVYPVSDCSGLPDGLYPSTKGCHDYVICKDGQLTKRKCRMSDFPSNKTTGNPGTGKQGKVSEFDYLLEYNHHSQKCEYLISPTCRRSSHYNILSDAPIDMYQEEEEEH